MIVLGRVVAPFGVHGWLRVHAFGDDPEAWKQMRQIWISDDAEAPAERWVVHELAGLRRHGDGVVAKLAGIDDRDASEALGSCFIGAPRDALPPPAEGEYYWGDLVGLSVENEAGETFGTVSGLLSTGAHDVLQVRDGKSKDASERLIPFVAAYVLDVDLAARRIRVSWQKDW